ncbi:lysosomal alpha-mannosidase-like [Battus philenor]|uniref:lysosomal alpha-mannosidase-like n=1 Tax=Battus philenor TaxID=42288 RepID=UPI0035CFF51A
MLVVLLACVCVCGSLAGRIPHSSSTSSNSDESCGYQSCTQADPMLLNVHIVPHTHDDVGWLKTVDQYYYGSRNNIQKAGVQYILDSVVKELWEDPKRRFIYVETAFFWKWWVRQSEEVQQRVRTLVRQGRLQMVGGAWSMNDEAASHYHSTIDQFTWGLSKLNQTFGACGRPRVGWQIDPFGHSREFASLLAAMGYDGLFLGRIDYQDKRNRFSSKKMEMIWRGDDNLGISSDIFTGVLFNTYSPPPGFCFDVLCDDEPIVDDPDSPMFNVDQKVDKFLEYVSEMGKRYRTDNVLVTMGGDFTYQDAGMWYTNLDKLIKYTNLKAGKDGLNIKAFYSTPNCYLKAVKDAYPSLPSKQDDFFPYASDPTAYWTGYFTSRPTTKYFERRSNVFLQMVKNLQVLVDLPKHNQFVIDELKSAMGVMQHHDAITGTEKQHVANDYVRMLNAAIDDAAIIPNQAFNKVLRGSSLPSVPVLQYQRCHFNESSCRVTEEKKSFVITIYNALAWEVVQPVRIPVVLGNYTIYDHTGKTIITQMIDIPEFVRAIPTRQSIATHELVFLAPLPPFGFVSYYVTRNEPKSKRNAGEANIKEHTSISDKSNKAKRIPDPVNYGNTRNIEATDLNVDILKNGGEAISDDILQLERIIGEVKRNMQRGGHQREDLAKKLNYPTLNDEDMRMLSDEPAVVSAFDDVVVENEHIKLHVDSATGQAKQVVTRNCSLNFTIRMYYWTGCSGDNSNTSQRSSGAYIFRPKDSSPIALKPLTMEARQGPIVTELRLRYLDNASSTIRLYSGLDFIEHDFVIGSIPVEDGVGKEYVVKYETGVSNDGVFYTDSNGRQMLKRKLNERPQWNLTLQEPIAGNYYPVTNEMYIEDDAVRLTVATDRSQGGTSLNEGDLELMLHRRLLHDDAFGVGEALNEIINGDGLVVRGQHRILVKPSDNPAEVINDKKQVLLFQYQPITMVADAEDLQLTDWIKLINIFKGVKDMPNGIHLLTLEPWKESTVLLRLENYLDKSTNSTVEVDLEKLFTKIKIRNLKETTLAANQWLKDKERWTWTTDEEFHKDNSADEYEERLLDDGLKVQLKAKQIRTFIAEYNVL